MTSTRHRRLGLAVALALGAALALPAPSLATTVSRVLVEGFSGPAVTISDGTGVTDGLSVSGSQTTTVRVSSVSRTGAGSPITAGSGCSQTSATVVTCPAATFLLATLAGGADSLTDATNLTVSLNGGASNDRLFAGSGGGTINGSTGDDRLGGGPGADTERGGDGNDRVGGGTSDTGRDTLEGGAGFDRLDAADGVSDAKIDCGSPGFIEGIVPGPDVALTDLTAKEPTPVGCETVQEGAKDQHPLVQVRRGSGRIRRGRVAIRLRCPKAAPGRRCRGRVSVKKGRRTLARGRYRIRKGRTRTIRLRLRRRARGRVRVLTRERDTNGRPETTRTLIRLRR
jgi:RTX calcium-binding nonapeptide repeat (4 copies)